MTYKVNYKDIKTIRANGKAEYKEEIVTAPAVFDSEEKARAYIGLLKPKARQTATISEARK